MSMEAKAVIVKGRKIGGNKPLICLPLVASTEETLLKEGEEVADLKPDLVEWRVDYFRDVENIEKVLIALKKLHHRLANYPLIFTCRRIEEGGARHVELSQKMALMKAVIETQKIDIMDIEQFYGPESIKDLQQLAHKNHVSVIISQHDFEKTPSKETIIEGLIRSQEYHADLAKVAVMPRSERDVLTLMEATLEAREKYLKIPLITMAMGELGRITRIAGGIFGSTVTFAAGKNSSAPGQMMVSQLRRAMEILYEEKES